MFRDWDRRQTREERRKRRRERLSNLVQLFTKTVATTLVTRYGWALLLAFLAVAGLAVAAYMRRGG